MPHAVLLGDSVFDNGAYVPGELPLIEQLKRKLPQGWQATCLAVDGNVTADVASQLRRLPADTTHLIVSVGGNDALTHLGILFEATHTVADALGRLADVQAEFRGGYRRMLERVLSLGKPTIACTIYDAIPGLERPALAALSLFNDVIVHEAARARVPVIDLRLVCTEAADYSAISPIEPSFAGGGKIASAIVAALTGHDLASKRTAV